MIHQRLVEELQRVARRYRWLFDGSALSAVWLACALIGACLLSQRIFGTVDAAVHQLGACGSD